MLCDNEENCCEQILSPKYSNTLFEQMSGLEFVMRRFTRKNEVWAGRTDCEGVLSAHMQSAGNLEARLLRYRGCLRTTPQIPQDTPARELYFVKRICLAGGLFHSVWKGPSFGSDLANGHVR